MNRRLKGAAGLQAGRAVIVLAVLAGVVLLAQNEPGQIFRGETTLVYVDAYPRQNDRLVEGLQSGDFQVFEDGKPQAIQTFEYIRFEPALPGDVRHDPTSVAESERQAADPRNRLFVVFLDLYHVSRLGMRDIPGPLLAFLDQSLAPNDLFALMTPEIPVSRLTFARNTLTILSDLRELTAAYDFDLETPIPRTEAERRMALCGGGKGLMQALRLDLVYRSLENLVVRLGTLRDERKNLLLFSHGWAVPEVPQSRPGRRGGAGLPPPITVVDGRLVRGNPRDVSANSAWCNAEIARLQNIDFGARFRELVTAAGRANVSISAIDPDGLQTNMVSPSLDSRTASARAASFDPNNLREPLHTLRTLAGANDGHAVVNTNDISIGMGRIAERLSSYYLLGYYSSNTANDGKYRKIEVKVARPRVSVSARPGYLAPPPPEVVARLKAEAAAVAGPAVRGDVTRALGPLARLEVDELFAEAHRRAAGIDVVVELPVRALEQGKWARGASLTVTASRTGAGSVSAQGQLRAGERSVIVHVPIADGLREPWQLRVRATGGESPVEARVDLTAQAAAVSVGSPLVLRVPAVARLSPQPVAQRRFQRGARLRVEWPVLGAIDGSSARLLDRKGQPIGAPLMVTDRMSDGARHVLVVDLAVTLADGDYVLELTAKSGDRTDLDLVPFRVAR